MSARASANGGAGDARAAGALDLSAPFERLRSGQALLTRGRTVTEADVVGFAALTGDWHPQHADASWAAHSRFGERIAHGLLIVSFAVGLLPLDPERVVALRRIADVTFKRPLRIGETIAVEARLGELRELDEELGLVALTLAIRNQDGALVCRARLEALWRRDPASGDAAALDGSPFSRAPGVVPC